MFDIFICWAVKGVKVQKIAQDDKKILSVALHISGAAHHTILINGTHVKKDNISSCFFRLFPNFNFWGLNSGAKK